jgi:hypothetical protein
MSAIEHPAAEVREDDLLLRAAQHVGAFGHEVHAAEDDVIASGRCAIWRARRNESPV